jgi:hypothetical protein
MMRALANDALLNLWERGAACGPVERALLLLSAALPEQDAESRARLPVGARDAAILDLRRATFGARLTGRLNCPHCREPLEFELDAGELLAGATPAESEFTLDDLRFRLPDSRDLAAIAHHDDADVAARDLLQRCCLDAARAPDWQALLEAAEERMAALGGAADIELRFDCAACGKAWTERLGVTDYVLEEISERARRLLDEVHWLAAQYGWSERQILSMSGARRDAYLQRCFA